MRGLTLSGAQARAFAQLHEAAHKGNRYGNTDLDGFVPQTFLNNYINNGKIWKACFGEVKATSVNSFPVPGSRQ